MQKQMDFSPGSAEGVLLLKAPGDDEVLSGVKEVEDDSSRLQTLGFCLTASRDIWSSYSVPRYRKVASAIVITLSKKCSTSVLRLVHTF